MASNKKFESSKKDMNFFSEFSGSSGQTSSYLSLILLVLLGFILVGGAIYGVIFVQTAAIRTNINTINEKMKNPEYQKNLVQYTEINKNLTVLNQQYFDLTALYSKVQNKTKIASSYMDGINKNIPSDIVITDFKYDNGTIMLGGMAESYYSPLDMLANFSKDKLFARVSIGNIMQYDLSSTDLTAEEVKIIKKYSFSVTCSLLSEYPVLISKFVDSTAATPLTAVNSKVYEVGKKYTETGVNTFTSPNGSIYTLNRVMIDGSAASAAVLAAIKESDSISGLVLADINIQLYYIPAITNGGAQK